jgi:hypothetical protein
MGLMVPAIASDGKRKRAGFGLRVRYLSRRCLVATLVFRLIKVHATPFGLSPRDEARLLARREEIAVF